MASKNKKIAAAVTAVTLAVTLAVGGTFAWQSISQEATNIVTETVNPGGRLHDDFDGSNDKNIYVENFGTQNIYARIQLSEYLAVGVNAHTLTAEEEPLIGSYDADSGTFTYETYYYGQENESDQYWTKDWDGQTRYMPTFNKDQDSLEADLNGTYEYLDGEGAADPYGDFKDYNDTATYPDDYSVTEDAWYDNDTDDLPNAHIQESVDNENVRTEEETHTIATSIDGTVISMQEWIDGGMIAGDYWVYDTDGWAYWANPIAPGTATGLLLDSITNLGLIDEDYYYAIHVTGQFITAGDIGSDEGTGFYTDGEPTEAALTLLETIGVKVPEANDEILTRITIGWKSDDPLNNTAYDGETVNYLAPGEQIKFRAATKDISDPNSVWTDVENSEITWTVTGGEGTTSISDEGLLVIDGNQKSPSKLDVTVAYRELSTTATYYVSTDPITITIEEENGMTTGFMTDTDYTFNATVMSGSTEIEPDDVSWSVTEIIDGAENSDTEAFISGGTFNTPYAGTYRITAFVTGLGDKSIDIDVENQNGGDSYSVLINGEEISSATETYSLSDPDLAESLTYFAQASGYDGEVVPTWSYETNNETAAGNSVSIVEADLSIGSLTNFSAGDYITITASTDDASASITINFEA